MALSEFAYKYTNDFGTGAPADGVFEKLSRCATGIEYAPGAAKLNYWDFTELWVGYPTVTFIWGGNLIQPADVLKVRGDWETYKQPINTAAPDTLPPAATYGTRSRAWLWRFNGEIGTWQVDTGMIDAPGESGFISNMANDFRVSIGRLGLHLNAHIYTGAAQPFDAADSGTDTYVIGSSSYQNNSWGY